jgi:4-amino-4-deoxy-L-arabinose transferase-like glycosyltransferase
MLLAFVNALCWSLITPPFQVTDEPDHFAYVQQLAEAGRLPSSSAPAYSSEELVAMQDLDYAQVRFRPQGRPIFSHAELQKLRRDLAQPLSRRGPGGAGVAASEPPLYYALETIPYRIGSSGTILDRLELMRALSALMAGFTALFAFLFLREALPGVRWAWTVGGIGVALAPLLGFVSGAVNPDALLFVVSAALFYCLARAYRRGLTPRSAIAIGVLIAVGLMTKLNFVGMAPGAVLGLILLARREARTSGLAVYYRSLTPALLIAVSPGVVYALINVLSNHAVFGIVSGTVSDLMNSRKSISGELGYIWQLYLPRLPGMHSDFGEIFTTRQLWFRNMVGLYGWSDTVFPRWVYNAALIPAGLIAALCIRAFAIARAKLRGRLAELVTYAVMAVGVLALVGAAGYHEFPNRAAEYAEPRYVLPMLALWGAVLALAARGAGRRWGPIAGIVIVVLVIAHDLFSQLQVIARYYG